MLNTSMSRSFGSQLLYPKGDKLCIVELKASLSDPKTIKPLSKDPAGTYKRRGIWKYEKICFQNAFVFHTLLLFKYLFCSSQNRYGNAIMYRVTSVAQLIYIHLCYLVLLSKLITSMFSFLFTGVLNDVDSESTASEMNFFSHLNRYIFHLAAT